MHENVYVCIINSSNNMEKNLYVKESVLMK